MLTDFERQEELQELFDALQEDVVLLRLALMGAQVQLDSLTLRGFLRLSNDLDEHIGHLSAFCQGV